MTLTPTARCTWILCAGLLTMTGRGVIIAVRVVVIPPVAVRMLTPTARRGMRRVAQHGTRTNC